MNPLIIVPVFNGFDSVKSLFRSPGFDVEARDVLVVDDASTCRETIGFLRDLAAEYPRVRVIRNQANLGFVRSANIGMISADSRDILLLNSDTVPAIGWLDEIMRLREDFSDVATISPLSNAAGFFSIPMTNERNEIVQGMEIDDYPGVLRRIIDRNEWPKYEVSPISCGFCQLISGAARAKLGIFDEFLFHRGYGEESDYCLRATAHGFTNIISFTSFVYHERAASFAVDKQRLKKRNARVLKAIHPTYIETLRAYEQRSLIGAIGQAFSNHVSLNMSG